LLIDELTGNVHMLETLTLHVDDESWPAVQPVIELILFSGKPRAELVHGFIDFYTAVAGAQAMEFRWYQTNVMKTCRRLDGRQAGIDQVALMLTDKKSVKSPFVGVEHHSGPKADNFGPPAFQFFSVEDLSDPADPVHQSFVRLCLPPHVAAQSEHLYQSCLAAASHLPFDSGYCGYSYYWETGSSDVERELARVNRGWLLRYPGLAPGEPLALINFADKGLLGVSWITFVGQDYVERLGGIDALAAALPDAQVTAIEPSRGVAIRAGEKPELGDVNRDQTLPNYGAVGEALAEVRVPDEWVENLALVGMNAEQVVEWFNRFFEHR
jgi:hypothetical protein